jgi:hypothetical protein
MNRQSGVGNGQGRKRSIKTLSRNKRKLFIGNN